MSSSAKGLYVSRPLGLYRDRYGLSVAGNDIPDFPLFLTSIGYQFPILYSPWM